MLSVVVTMVTKNAFVVNYVSGWSVHMAVVGQV